MVEGRREVLHALATHAWPAGLRVEVDDDVLRVSAARPGRVDVAVVAGIAIVIPAVVIALSRHFLGVAAGVAFAIAVVAIGFQRFRGAQCVTVDLAAGRVHVEHANPAVARRFGLAARSAALTDVVAVEVTRVMMGSRTEPHGRRVALQFADGTTAILGEFAAPATGLFFARSVGSLLGAPLRED